MSAPVLEIRDLRLDAEDASVDAPPIVRDISLSVQSGEVHALIGESGSGKTTIALAAMGYVRPGMKRISGEVLLNGTNLFALSPGKLRGIRGDRVSYVAQSAAASFNPSLRIEEQVIEAPREHCLMSSEDARSRAIELCRELRIPSPETIARRFPHEVSGGQLQRLMAAMAMVSAPDLIIFDEPTTALDVTTQLSVLMSFRAMIKQRKTAAIYVTHDLAVVAQIADRVTVLLDGQIQEQAPVQEIVEAPKNEYSRVLMAAGTPATQYDHSATAAHSAAAPLLEMKSVDAGYGRIGRDGRPRHPVLRSIDLELESSSILGLIGESGSGKSTMAHVIAGLLPAAQGDIQLQGEALERKVERRSKETVRRIQIVSQSADTALNPSHTVAKILGRPVSYFLGLKGRERDARIAELLDLVSLPPDLAGRRSAELSGGQKQRVNLARALAANPDIILCDEVTSALDSIIRNAIIELIAELRDRLNLAIIFISHDVSTVSRITDQLAVMNKGEIVEIGPTGRVLTDPQHAYTRLLLDSVPRVEIGWITDAYERVQVEQAALKGINP